MRFDELVPSHPFEDEITRTLRFTGAGILAMVWIMNWCECRQIRVRIQMDVSSLSHWPLLRGWMVWIA